MYGRPSFCSSIATTTAPVVTWSPDQVTVRPQVSRSDVAISNRVVWSGDQTTTGLVLDLPPELATALTAEAASVGLHGAQARDHGIMLNVEGGQGLA